MSIINEVTGDIYRQMIELQEKLKQSEAERVRLEGMFSVLIKTFKEEEDKRLKNLESRYNSFLEDCARRSNRNEKILRSVERVESGANVLYAKTERLKQLRSHYEAYLERVMPSWRQPFQLRYGSTPYLPDMDWTSRSHLILDDDSTRGSYPGFRKPWKFQYTETERLTKPFPGARVDKNFLTQDSKKFDERYRVLYGPDRGYSDDYRRGRFDDEDEVFKVKTVSHYPKQTVETRRDESDDAWNDRTRDSPEKEPARPSDNVTEGLDEWARGKGQENVPREYSERPRMTREPVEIKKPEFIVGKLHPEATSKFEYPNRVPDEVKTSPPTPVATPLDPVPEARPESTAAQGKLVGKWSLLKHRSTIDQLRESLKKQEEILTMEEPAKTEENTDVSQSLSECWDAKEGPYDEENKIEMTERNTTMVEYADEPQEEYEDNEEAYPESYYEQPSKPKYSRNLVGNVILEEDESEVNVNEEPPVNLRKVEQDVEPEPPINVDGEKESQYVENVNLHNTGEEQDVPHSGNEDGYRKSEPKEGGYAYQDQTEYQYPNQEYYEQQPVGQTGDSQNLQNTAEEYKEGQPLQEEYSLDQQYQQEYGQDQQYQQEYNEDQQYQEDYSQDQLYQPEYGEEQQYQQEYVEGQEYQQEYIEGQQYQQQYDASQIPPDGSYYNAEEQQYYQQGGQYEEGGDGYPVAYPAEGSENPQSEESQGESNQQQLPLRQNNLAHLLESDSESFQIEHGSAPVNDDSDFDFSISQQQ